MDKKGQMGVGALVIVIIIGLIMIIAVAVPVTKSMVTTANLSGTDSTIANVLVTLLLVGAVALVGGLAFFAMRGK